MDSFQLGLLLQTMIEAMAVNVEVEAMKAANQDRERQGQVQAYPEETFKEKSGHLWALSNQAREQVR